MIEVVAVFALSASFVILYALFLAWIALWFVPWLRGGPVKYRREWRRHWIDWWLGRTTEPPADDR